jgi:hypothetical protein
MNHDAHVAVADVLRTPFDVINQAWPCRFLICLDSISRNKKGGKYPPFLYRNDPIA